MVRRKMFTQKLFRKTKSPQTRAALQKNSSAGLISIIAGDSMPHIGDTLAPTRRQRIDSLIIKGRLCVRWLAG